jgi:hypothetical protein
MMGGESEIVVVLEKAPGPTIPSSYLLLATKLTGTLQKEVEQAAEKGFQVAAIAARREHLVILEKQSPPPGDGPAAAAAPSRTDATNKYLLLAAEKTSTLQKELDQAAKTGYRIVAGSATGETQAMMLLQKVAQPPLTFQYKLLAAHKTSTLQKELNDAAASDFCLRGESVSAKRAAGGKWRSLGNVGIGGIGGISAAAAPDEIVSVLEKAPNAPRRCQYLVVGTMKTATMQRELHKAALEGFQVVAMVGNQANHDSGQLMGVMANLVVILEKQLGQ